MSSRRKKPIIFYFGQKEEKEEKEDSHLQGPTEASPTSTGANASDHIYSCTFPCSVAYRKVCVCYHLS